MTTRDLHLQAVAKADAFLQNLLRLADLDLRYQLAIDASGNIAVEFDGQDAELLTQDGGELLFALQHLTAQVLDQPQDLTFHLDYQAHLPPSWQVFP